MEHKKRPLLLTGFGIVVGLCLVIWGIVQKHYITVAAFSLYILYMLPGLMFVDTPEQEKRKRRIQTVAGIVFSIVMVILLIILIKDK